MAEENKRWMKLDNAAKIYPAAKSRNWTALFRLSALLTEPVDPMLLARAQQSTLRRFPGFALRLRHGFFWYYLEHNEGAPIIQRDVANPCVRMDLRENDGFMFRVRYYGRRIALEVFHVLADGTGGFCFLKTLVAEYLKLRYGAEIPRDAQILDCSEQPRPDELEDSYLKYARRVSRSRREADSYRIVGTDEERNFMNIVTGVAPADRVLACAKAQGVTLTEFLTGVLIQSICRIQRQDHSRRRRNQPVKICIPINLRRFYPTNTMRNFASYVNVGIEPRYGEYTLAETCKAVHFAMGLEVTEKMLNAKIAANVNTERNAALRATPLFLKKPAMKFAFRLKGDRKSSSTISNLGRTELPPEMARYVERLDFMLGSLCQNRVTCACVSYRNQLVINFTRAIRESAVERNFFTALVKLGIPVRIESNQR